MKLYDETEFENYDDANDTWEIFSYDLKEALDFSDDIYVIYGSFGRWDGPVMGGSIIRSYNDFMRFLSFRGDHQDVFSDDKGEFNVTQYHHDGSNHYIMRKLSKRGLERYWNHMSNVGEADSELLKSLTSVKDYTRKAQLAKTMGYI